MHELFQSSPISPRFESWNVNVKLFVLKRIKDDLREFYANRRLIISEHGKNVLHKRAQLQYITFCSAFNNPFIVEKNKPDTHRGPLVVTSKEVNFAIPVSGRLGGTFVRCPDLLGVTFQKQNIGPMLFLQSATAA